MKKARIILGVKPVKLKNSTIANKAKLVVANFECLRKMLETIAINTDKAKPDATII